MKSVCLHIAALVTNTIADVNYVVVVVKRRKKKLHIANIRDKEKRLKNKKCQLTFVAKF